MYKVTVSRSIHVETVAAVMVAIGERLDAGECKIIIERMDKNEQ